MGLAIATCEAAMARMHAALEPGVTEVELWSILHHENIARGGEWIETRLLSAGPRTNPWFQEASRRPIEEGELVSYDTDLIGPFGYCADLSRALMCGAAAPSAGQRTIYRLAHQQIACNIDSLRPGLTTREYAERSFVLPEHYTPKRYPVDFARAGYDAVIEPGMTLCIESTVGPVEGAQGVKLAEQVVVTESGVERLSGFPFETDLLA